MSISHRKEKRRKEIPQKVQNQIQGVQLKKRRISHTKWHQNTRCMCPGWKRLNGLAGKEAAGIAQGEREEKRKAAGPWKELRGSFIISRNARSPKLRLKYDIVGGRMHQEVSYSSETVGPGRPRAKGPPAGSKCFSRWKPWN